MGDFRPFEHGTNWGLFVAQHGAHFKVLDVYEYQGKCRKHFESKCMGEVIPELATNEWIARCQLPLGISNDGVFFEKE